jgi:hypothetical protein
MIFTAGINHKTGYMKLATFKKFTQAGIILIAAIFIHSCKKNPVSEPQTGGPLKLASFMSGNEYVRFMYNVAGQVSKVTLSSDEYSVEEEVTYNVSYLQGNKINELTGDNGVKIKLTYEGSALVKSEAFAGNNRAYETVYEYVDGDLRSTIIKLVDNNVVTPIIKLITYYEAGNPTTIDTYLVNPVTGQMQPAGFVIRKYDNKPNPFAGSKDLMMVLLHPVSSNNVIREDYFDTDINPQQTIETEYIYNTSQLPVKATKKETSPGKEPVVETGVYSYK